MRGPVGDPFGYSFHIKTKNSFFELSNYKRQSQVPSFMLFFNTLQFVTDIILELLFGILAEHDG